MLKQTHFRLALAFSTSGVMVVASSLHASDLSRYRDFTLGSTIAAVASTTGVSRDDIKVIHEKPALIQELRWRPARYGATAMPTDPVQEVVFSFYNDQLFSIVVDYDRLRTEGLTNADLIDSVAANYGPPVLTSTKPLASIPPTDAYVDSTVVARWSDADSSLTLIRGNYPRSLKLVVSSRRIQLLADTATNQAIHLERQQAPQRELDRQKKAVEESRTAAEKARLANKPVFKP